MLNIKEKYCPKTLDELTFNPLSTELLRRIPASNTFPNLIFAGPPGSGKKTRMKIFLRSVFSPNVDIVTKSRRKIKIETKKKTNFKFDDNIKEIEVNIKSSAYHIELTPSDLGVMDHYVISHFLKDLARTQVADSSQIKIIVIKKAHLLSRLAQQALRRTMEQFTSITRIILIVDTIDHIIDPLRSRSLIIRTPRISIDDMRTVIDPIINGEKFVTTLQQTDAVLAKCNGNADFAIMLLLQSVVEHKIPVIPWQDYVDQLVVIMLSNFSKPQASEMIKRIRNHLYELLCHQVDPTLIFRRLLQQAFDYTESTTHSQISAAAAEYEFRMRNGKHPIVHLEAFCSTLMAIHQKFIDEECIVDSDDDSSL